MPNCKIDFQCTIIGNAKQSLFFSSRLEYYFNFDQPFEIRDEVDTLKRMGLTLRLGSTQCTQEEYSQCLELIPPSLRFYVEGRFRVLYFLSIFLFNYLSDLTDSYSLAYSLDFCPTSHL